MRMLHFSADNGNFEGVWFTDENESPAEITAELDRYSSVGPPWRFDWETDVPPSGFPATECLYLKTR